MSDFTRERALYLIQTTISQFHEDVMIPLNSSMRQRPYIDGQSNAEALNARFHIFSQGVANLEGSVSREIAGLDNFRLSQLLSLCRDISELYSLEVYSEMPGFIADDNLLDANPEDPEPLRYVAPGVRRGAGAFRRRTRDRPHRDAELAFAREVLGPIGERAYKNSVIRRLPGRGANMNSGLSIPLPGVGKIWLGGDVYRYPMDSNWGRNLFIHEVFHQVQYLQGIPVTRLAGEVMRHDRTPARLWRARDNARNAAASAAEHSADRDQRIANEITDRAADRAANRAERTAERADRRVERAQMRVERNAARANPRPNVYAYDLRVNSLSDLPHYEAQASLVGDFAQHYYQARHNKEELFFNRRGTIKNMARILENSGFITEATRWVDANL
jgi:hypothetical protein